MGDAPYTDDLDLDAVTTRADLADRLRLVRIRADNPSLRTLETRARHRGDQLSKTVVGEMLKGVRHPSKAAMVAFLRACEVPADKIGSWQRTWDRVTSYEAGQTLPETTQAIPSQQAQVAPQHPSTKELAAVTRSWHFSDPGPVTLICAQLPKEETGTLGQPARPQLHRASILRRPGCANRIVRSYSRREPRYESVLQALF